MLRRVNAALFEAPPGARIQIVAEARNNNSVNDPTFEYGGRLLTEETILGLPGCSFTVNATEFFEAGVVFDPDASASARYDLFEVENGVKSNLQKFVRSSDPTNLIGFTIEPMAFAISEAGGPGPGFAPAPGAARPPAARKAAKRKAPKKRTAPKKKGPVAAKRSVSGKKAASKRAPKTKTRAAKKSPRRTSTTRKTSRTRGR